MSNIRYTEYKKKQRGRYVWGVLQMEGRKQKFQTVGEGEGARRKAKKLAQRLNQMEEVETSPEDRFLSWHWSGEPLPLDRALFLFGIRSGFRISEILSLRLGDVIQAGRVVERVRVQRRHMKGKREGRTVPLHPAAREALGAWLEELRTAGYMTADSFVFQSRRGPNQAIGRVQAWRILRRAFEQAGLTGNLGTHSMRKTFADRIYERLDGDLVKTARALSHRSISSTASYLTFRESEIDDAILSSRNSHGSADSGVLYCR